MRQLMWLTFPLWIARSFVNKAKEGGYVRILFNAKWKKIHLCHVESKLHFNEMMSALYYMSINTIMPIEGTLLFELHKLCATFSTSVNINYRLPIKVYYRILFNAKWKKIHLCHVESKLHFNEMMSALHYMSINTPRWICTVIAILHDNVF
jgi:hypothetical protein